MRRSIRGRLYVRFPKGANRGLNLPHLGNSECMAERVEFELAVSVCWARPSLRRIESESEPPNVPTEKNADCCAFEAANPPSPVRMRQSPDRQNPAESGDLVGCA